MRAVDAPRGPFFHHEALEIGRVAAQVDRGNFQGDQRVGFDIDRQINVAAAAGVHLSDDTVSIEHHPCVEQRRRRQLELLAEQFVRRAVRQFIDADDLDGQVVGAAQPVGLLDDGLGRGVKIVRVLVRSNRR